MSIFFLSYSPASPKNKKTCFLDLLGGNDRSCCLANGSNCFFLEERKKKREEEGGLRPDYGIFLKERAAGQIEV